MSLFRGLPEALATPASGLIRPDGPTWQASERRLLFSDTVEGSLWQWSEPLGLQRLTAPSAGGCSPSATFIGLTPHEVRLRERHEYCPVARTLSGPSGTALDSRGLLVTSELGGRRVVRRNATTLVLLDVLAASVDDLPLNSPAEVAIDPVHGAILFTDPYAGLAETNRLPEGDSGYADAKSALGFAGVFRVPAPRAIGAADLNRPQVLLATLDRPGGLAFETQPLSAATGSGTAHVGGGSPFWVSECCQGHAPTCPVGTARWHRYAASAHATASSSADQPYQRQQTIEWRQPPAGGRQDQVAGCAAGLKTLARTGANPARFDPPSLADEGAPPLLVAACPLGVCVLDPSAPLGHQLVEHVPFQDLRVSNVAFGSSRRVDVETLRESEEAFLYVTGEGHLWRVVLAPRAATWALRQMPLQKG